MELNPVAVVFRENLSPRPRVMVGNFPPLKLVVQVMTLVVTISTV